MGIERLTSFLFQKTGLLGFRKGTYDEKKTCSYRINVSKEIVLRGKMIISDLASLKIKSKRNITKDLVAIPTGKFITS